MYRRRVLGLAGTVTATSLAGCTGVFENASSSYENGTYIGCTGDAYPDRIEFDCDRFDGATGRIFPVEAGTTLQVNCRTNIESGAIRFLLRDPDDEVRWEHTHDGPSVHEQQTSVEASDGGSYEMRVEGDDVEGSFELRWELNR